MRASIRMKWGCRIKSAGAIEIGFIVGLIFEGRLKDLFQTAFVCLF